MKGELVDNVQAEMNQHGGHRLICGRYSSPWFSYQGIATLTVGNLQYLGYTEYWFDGYLIKQVNAEKFVTPAEVEKA